MMKLALISAMSDAESLCIPFMLIDKERKASDMLRTYDYEM